MIKAVLGSLFSIAILCAPVAAAERGIGKETGRPLPRFVSLKSNKVNVRRGPSVQHRVDWVFVRRHLPVEVVAEYGNWRRVRDHDGATGWVHYALLRGERTVLVTGQQAGLRKKPDYAARLKARAEIGVVADLEECRLLWCRVEAKGYEGWIEKSEIWGVYPNEIFK